MERLSTLDAQFLVGERRETPMNMGFIALFDRTPPDAIERFKAQILARLDALPVLKRRLQPSAGWYDVPSWSAVDTIDVAYHLRHSALPPPGSLAELRALVARLHATLLDRSEPLWQFYLIEGVENGRFALYLKLHHAALDGGAAMMLLDALFDDAAPERSERDASPPAPPAVPEPKTFVEAWWESYTDFQRRSARVFQTPPELAPPASLLPPPAPRPAPMTPFNVIVSERRDIGTWSVSLDDVKRTAKTLGVKLNDVVLSACAGALRTYLAQHGGLPAADLIAAIPVSLREPGDAQMNNQVSMLYCDLATSLADPVARTARIAASMQEQKAVVARMKGWLRFGVSTLAAPIPAGALADSWFRLPAGTPVPGLSNVLISNVAGPKTHLSLAGASAEHYYPVSIASHGGALNITVQSYAEHLEFCLIACHDAVPDVQMIAEAIGNECAALQRQLA